MDRVYVFDKIIKFFNQIEDRSKSHDDLSVSEYFSLLYTVITYSFLSRIAKIKDFKDEEIINRAFNDNTYLTNIYIENTFSFDNLLNKKKLLKEAYKNQNFPISIPHENVNNNYLTELLYEKNGKFIEEYLVIKPAYSSLKKGFANSQDKAFKSIRIPLILEKDKIDTKNFKCETDSNNNKIFYIPRQFFYKQSIENVPHELLDDNEIFIEDGDLLVCKEFYEHEDYKHISEIRRFLSKMLILNNSGEILDKYTPSTILHHIVTTLRHYKQFIYNIDYDSYALDEKMPNNVLSAQGFIFITKEKDKFDKSLLFKRAFIIDLNIMNRLQRVASNFRIEKNFFFEFLFVPRQGSNLDIDKFLNDCKYISVQFDSPQNTYFVNELIDDAIQKYSISNTNTDFYQSLSKLLSKHSLEGHIQIHDLVNKHFLKNILSLKTILFNNQSKKNHLLEDYFKFFVHFYGFEIIKNPDFINSVGYTKIIHPYIKQVNGILNNILLSFFRTGNLYVKDTPYQEKCQNYQIYKNEIYIVLSLLISYRNMIENNFAEELFEDNQDALRVLESLDFGNFTVNNTPFNDFEFDKVKLKKIILKSLRNSISHYTPSIKITDNGDWKEYYFCLKYHLNNEKFVIRISLNNYIAFINNKNLANYNLNTSFIKASNFNKLIENVRKILQD